MEIADIAILQDNPHKNLFEMIETKSDTSLSRIARIQIKQEGYRDRPYLDSEGIVTIGIGHSLQTNGISINELHAILDDIQYRYLLENTSIRNGRIYIKSLASANKIFNKPLSEYDVGLLLMDDLKNVNKEANSVFGSAWSKIDEPRREAIVTMIFNLGLPHFKTFKKFIGHVKNLEWSQAADEVLLSEAARDNITRYYIISSVIRTGDDSYFIGDK